MKSTLLAFFFALLLVFPSFAAKKAPIRVLLIDGQNNHNWKSTTPVMVEALQNPQTGFHRVEFLPGSERVQIVLPVQELVSADERIMKNFQIPRLQSL